MENTTSKRLKKDKSSYYNISKINQAYGSDTFIHNIEEKGMSLDDFVDDYPSFYFPWGKSTYVQETINERSDIRIRKLQS